MTSRASQFAARAVSSKILLGLVEAAERLGLPNAELLRAEVTNVSESERVGGSTLDRICERAIELTGDPALGLHWVERIPQSTFVPVPYVALHAANLRQAFQLVARFSSLFVDYPFFELLEDGELVILRSVPVPGRSAAMDRFAAEMFIGGFVNLVRLVWAHPRFERISFRHPAPHYHREYARVLGHEPSFDQAFTEIVLTRALFDAPSPHHDGELASTLINLAQLRLAHVARQLPLSQRAHSVLVKSGATRVTMAAVASALGMSARSLRRHLHEEGVSYAKVEHDALGTVAANLLRDYRTSIKDVASRMGFSDVTGFHRAFKRWTGKTPNHVRFAR